MSRYTYRTEEFGEISQKELTETLIDQFHAKRPKHKSNKKQLLFDIELINPLIKDLLSSYESHNDVKAIDIVTKLQDGLLKLNYPDDDTLFNKIRKDSELMHTSLIHYLNLQFDRCPKH